MTANLSTPSFSEALVNQVYEKMSGLIDWVASSAVELVALLFFIYACVRIFKFYVLEQNQGRFTDVLADLGLRLGILGLFLIPTNITMLPTSVNALQFQPAPLVMWLPYQATYAGWKTANIACGFAFPGCVGFTDVPSAFARELNVSGAVKRVVVTAADTNRALGPDLSQRIGEAGSGDDSWFSYQSIGKAASAGIIGLTGALGDATTGFTTTRDNPIGAILGGLLAGGAGAAGPLLSHALLEIFFMLGVWLAFFGCLISYLMKSCMLSFSFILNICVLAISARQGTNLVTQGVTRGFALALQPLAMVFAMKVLAVIYLGVVKGFLIDHVIRGLETSALSSGLWVAGAAICGISLPLIFTLPLVRIFTQIPGMLMDSLGGNAGSVSVGSTEHAGQRGLSMLKHIPGV